MPKTPCAYAAPHVIAHSEDRVEVHHGRPEPVILCGYHAQPEWIGTAFAWLRAQREEAEGPARDLHTALARLADKHDALAAECGPEKDENETWQDEAADWLRDVHTDVAATVRALLETFPAPAPAPAADAPEDVDFNDPTTWDRPLTDANALSLGIFALNTLAHPEGSSDSQLDALDFHTAGAVERLADLRERLAGN